MANGLNRVRLRWMATVLAMALLTLVAVAAWFYHATHRDARRQAETELAAIARTRASQVVEWRRERLGDANVLMGNPFLTLPVSRYLALPDPGDGKMLLRLFGNLQKQYGYADVLLVDQRGVVRLSGSGGRGLEQAARQRWPPACATAPPSSGSPTCREGALRPASTWWFRWLPALNRTARRAAPSSWCVTFPATSTP